MTADASDSPFSVLDPKNFAAELSYLRAQGYQGSDSMTFGDLLNWAMTGSDRAWVLLTELMGFTPGEIAADPFNGDTDIWSNHVTWKNSLLAVGLVAYAGGTLLTSATCLVGDPACLGLGLVTSGIGVGTSILEGGNVAYNLASLSPTAYTAWLQACAADPASCDWPEASAEASKLAKFSAASGAVSNYAGIAGNLFGLYFTFEGALPQPGPSVQSRGSMLYIANADGSIDRSWSVITTTGFAPTPVGFAEGSE